MVRYSPVMPGEVTGEVGIHRGREEEGGWSGYTEVIGSKVTAWREYTSRIDELAGRHLNRCSRRHWSTRPTQPAVHGRERIADPAEDEDEDDECDVINSLHEHVLFLKRYLCILKRIRCPLS